MPPSVVVVGGHGFFGRLVVDDLLRATKADVVVAGRAPRLLADWDARRVSLARFDQHDAAAVRDALARAAVVVHTAGPYQGLEPSVLRAALDSRVPYVDLADDRDFVRRAERVVGDARQPCSTVVLGMSFVPGLCAQLAEPVRADVGSIERVRCVAAPGSRGSRGIATLRSLLSHAGRRFDVPRAGGDETVHGWSDPRRVAFPPPIGVRTAYLAIPVADFDLFPRWFGCADVEFRACSDQASLDRFLWAAAGAQRFVPIPVLRGMGRVMGGAVRVAGRFGTDAGAGMVEIASRDRTVRIAVVAPDHSERLPALPAAIACAEILDGRLRSDAGLVGAHRAVASTRFVAELVARGLSVWIDDGRGWSRSGADPELRA